MSCKQWWAFCCLPEKGYLHFAGHFKSISTGYSSVLGNSEKEWGAWWGWRWWGSGDLFGIEFEGPTSAELRITLSRSPQTLLCLPLCSSSPVTPLPPPDQTHFPAKWPLCRLWWCCLLNPGKGPHPVICVYGGGEAVWSWSPWNSILQQQQNSLLGQLAKKKLALFGFINLTGILYLSAWNRKYYIEWKTEMKAVIQV